LIIDDSRVAREAARRMLVGSGLFDEVLQASDGAEALAVLAERDGEAGVDLVLCDLLMPEVDGFTFLERLGDLATGREIPVIVLTAEHDVDIKVQALEAGASDYLTTPVADAELGARVKVHLDLHRLREELRDANERLRDMVNRDPLTGVYNQRHWRNLLARELARSRRHGRMLSVIVGDLDHFKGINDRFGHLAGDLVLKAAAGAFTENLRSHDSVGRYGGEEFVVLLPETGLEEAVRAAERLRRAIADLRFDGQDELRVSISLGVAEATDDASAGVPGTQVPGQAPGQVPDQVPGQAPDQAPPNGSDSAFDPSGPTVDALIHAADEALYEAKRAGRDRVVAAPVAVPV
jgi:diguanylate cyclase (GGDEF)-like protein